MRFPFVSRTHLEAVYKETMEARQRAHEARGEAHAARAEATWWREAYERADAERVRLTNALLEPQQVVAEAPAMPTPDALLPPAVVAAIAYEANGNPALQRQLQRQALRMAAEQVHPDQMARRILTGDRVTSEDE